MFKVVEPSISLKKALEEFLISSDDELEDVVKTFNRDCFILSKGLAILDKSLELKDIHKKTLNISNYLYDQTSFLLC